MGDQCPDWRSNPFGCYPSDEKVCLVRASPTEIKDIPLTGPFPKAFTVAWNPVPPKPIWFIVVIRGMAQAGPGFATAIWTHVDDDWCTNSPPACSGLFSLSTGQGDFNEIWINCEDSSNLPQIFEYTAVVDGNYKLVRVEITGVDQTKISARVLSVTDKGPTGGAIPNCSSFSPKFAANYVYETYEP
jgi:hypothetical protein